MSVTNISLKNKLLLWGKAAGRCEYEGCNIPLWVDSLTKSKFNISYIAHIIADSPSGPRGDLLLSEKLKDDLSNLMLLCDVHHRLIDKECVAEHNVERLLEMKATHENRIEILSSITPDKRSHVLFYGANIGRNTPILTWQNAAQAMKPDWYPAELNPIEISLVNSSFTDKEENFWVMERENLRRLFLERVKGRLANKDIMHLSVFAVAPQPLLIELGRLLSDITSVQVYQLHREPHPGWEWQECPDDFDYSIQQPSVINDTVAINLSLSADIDDVRITDVIGQNVSIWKLTVNHPNNDFVKNRKQISRFREVFRHLLNQIKTIHGHNNILHVFPAIPVSIALEVGRVWMPKADLSLRIYDENRGFNHAFDVE